MQKQFTKTIHNTNHSKQNLKVNQYKQACLNMAAQERIVESKISNDGSDVIGIITIAAKNFHPEQFSKLQESVSINWESLLTVCSDQEKKVIMANQEVMDLVVRTLLLQYRTCLDGLTKGYVEDCNKIAKQLGLAA